MATARVTALLSIAAVPLLFFFDPATTAWFPWCPFHELTGLNCPFCGAARALHALLHLDVVAALRANALVATAIGPLALLTLSGSAGQGADLLARLATPRTLTRVVIGLAAFGIARNIPVWPFIWLNP